MLLQLIFDIARHHMCIRFQRASNLSSSFAGIQSETACFSHGQLCVSCSRVDSGKDLHVFVPDEKRKKIVRQNAWQWNLEFNRHRLCFLSY